MILKGKILSIKPTKKGFLFYCVVPDGDVVRVFSKENGVSVGDEVSFNVPLSFNDVYFLASAGKNK